MSLHQITTAEQTLTAWAVVGVLWVVMGTAGLDLSAQFAAFHRHPIGIDAINYMSAGYRRFWQRFIGLALIISGTAVTLEALIRLYLLKRL